MINGVVRNLDASLVLHPPIFGNDLLRNCCRSSRRAAFIVLAEIATFLYKFLRPAIMVEPNKAPPNLDIPDVLIGKGRRLVGSFRRSCSSNTAETAAALSGPGTGKKRSRGWLRGLLQSITDGLEGKFERWITRLPPHTLRVAKRATEPD